jgi:hypothetical protein
MGVTHGMDLLGVIVWLSRPRGDRHLETLGSADAPTKCSRLQEPLRTGERAIPCRGALLNLGGRPQRVAFVKADEPKPPLSSPAPTLTSFPAGGSGPFLSPVFREDKGSSLQSRFYVEICPAFGRATLAQHVVMTNTFGQPYLSRPIRCSHNKPRSECFFDIKICPDNLFRRISFPVSRLLCALRCRQSQSNPPNTPSRMKAVSRLLLG